MHIRVHGSIVFPRHRGSKTCSWGWELLILSVEVLMWKSHRNQLTAPSPKGVLWPNSDSEYTFYDKMTLFNQKEDFLLHGHIFSN